MDHQRPCDTSIVVESKNHYGDTKNGQVSKNYEGVELHVSNLAFLPGRRPIKKYLEYLRYNLTLLNLGWLLPFYTGTPRKLTLRGAELHNVSFKACSGELVALMGDAEERHELIELITGRKMAGKFEGNISLSGPGLASSSYYYEHVTYVQKKPLFIPGLTYMDMIRYSARLRLKDTSKETVNRHVEEIIDIMKLQHCKNRTIPQYAPTRGLAGSDMRRLSIAVEIVELPRLVVINEPTLDFDPAIGINITDCCRALANKGTIVICSMNKPSMPVFALYDKVVVLSEGYSIYANSPSNVEPYFCSPTMNYVMKKGIDVVDFIMDVSSGVERPTTSRTAELPSIMQENYESSEYYEEVGFAEDHANAFSKDFFHMWGLLMRSEECGLFFKRLMVVVERSFVTKVKDFRAIVSSLVAVLLVGSILGYLQWDQGNYGHYTVTLFGTPYLNTLNIAALFFFTTVFTFSFAFKDTHIFCQKLQLFRYEQAAGVCTLPAFITATAISEVPFFMLWLFILENIVFFMVNLHKGPSDYGYFMSLMLMSGMVGLSLAFMMASILKKELVVRDMFFTGIVIVILLSGFPVQKASMRDYWYDISSVNPARWVYEAVMQWKFENYTDGVTYLTTYEFQAFDHNDVFGILTNFLLAINGITILALMPKPLLLRRLPPGSSRRNSRSTSRASLDSTGDGLEYLDENAPPRKSTRASETVKPLLFMRESTVTGQNSKMSINLSQIGQGSDARGPTVLFKDITYRVQDRSSPVGYKTILNRISGQFDWGKLSMIMGAPESGKSSLMHILAGDIANGTEVGGTVTYNGKVPDPKQKLWDRCAFVPMEIDHIRDLTTKEVITFAAKLRCNNLEGLAQVPENVQITVEQLHLTEVVNKKVKFLNKGEFKRLSVAEEIVAGPKLLFMDEPTTNVSLLEVSIMLLCFRELINADRTVVATIHQPTAEVFNMFDTLVLLSKGRVIYQGPVKKAMDYFISCPYGYQASNYVNPAEFIADISSGHLVDRAGESIDASLLENVYMQTDFYQRLRARLSPKPHGHDRTVKTTANPLNAGRNSGVGDGVDSGSNNLSMTEYDDTQTSASFELESDHAAILKKTKQPIPTFVLAWIAFYRDVLRVPTCAEFNLFYFKQRILFHRACLALGKRYGLIMASILLHFLLALIFVWVIDADTANVVAILAYFAIGSVFLIFANVQFVFYIYNNYQVFLREHSRGLYSVMCSFQVTSLPLYLLRIINAVLYILTSFAGLKLDHTTDEYGFATVSCVALVLVGVMISEALIFSSTERRGSYATIPAVAFLNFIFSGLFIKAASLPEWMRPWVPSLSIVRWFMQCNFINSYDGDTTTFPTINSNNGYSNYTAFLNIFGWGGKTKWYCFYMLLVNIAIYRVLSLFAAGYTAFVRKGSRKRPAVVE